MAVDAAKPKRTGKTKADQQSGGQFGVGDIRKAAAFVNAVGGLDKAIAVLQILKVAKEVQYASSRQSPEAARNLATFFIFINWKMPYSHFNVSFDRLARCGPERRG